MEHSVVTAPSPIGLKLGAALVLFALIVASIAQVLFVEADYAIFVGEESGSCLAVTLLAILPGTALLFAKNRKGLGIAYLLVGTLGLVLYSVVASFTYGCIIRTGCQFY